MAEGIFAGFSSFGGLATIGKYVLLFFIFLIIALSITAIIIMIIVKTSQTKIIEISMSNKRIRKYTGRYKGNKKGSFKQFWIRKIKRFLPRFQEEDIYLDGKRDTLLLLKDNNGLFHTARIPTFEELVEYYKAVHKINLKTCKTIPQKPGEKEKDIELTKLRHIYLLPSPHEDLDWLAGQAAEAEKEFKIEHWWQSPTVAYIGVGFVCFLMLMGTLVLSGKV